MPKQGKNRGGQHPKGQAVKRSKRNERKETEQENVQRVDVGVNNVENSVPVNPLAMPPALHVSAAVQPSEMQAMMENARLLQQKVDDMQQQQIVMNKFLFPSVPERNVYSVQNTQQQLVQDMQHQRNMTNKFIIKLIPKAQENNLANVRSTSTAPHQQDGRKVDEAVCMQDKFSPSKLAELKQQLMLSEMMFRNIPENNFSLQSCSSSARQQSGNMFDAPRTSGMEFLPSKLIQVEPTIVQNHNEPSARLLQLQKQQQKLCANTVDKLPTEIVDTCIDDSDTGLSLNNILHICKPLEQAQKEIAMLKINYAKAKNNLKIARANNANLNQKNKNYEKYNETLKEENENLKKIIISKNETIKMLKPSERKVVAYDDIDEPCERKNDDYRRVTYDQKTKNHDDYRRNTFDEANQRYDVRPKYANYSKSNDNYRKKYDNDAYKYGKSVYYGKQYDNDRHQNK